MFDQIMIAVDRRRHDFLGLGTPTCSIEHVRRRHQCVWSDDAAR